MRRSFLAGALALAVPISGVAGEAPLPVCGRVAVLERVGEMLHQAGRDLVLETPAGEISTGGQRVVHCAVRARMVGYDTLRYGLQPVDAVFIVHYTLQLGQNGMLLSLD